MINLNKIFILTTMLGLVVHTGFAQSAGGLEYVETADGQRKTDTRELVQWTHTRLMFKKDLKRVAVGQNNIMEVEILGGREVLILAKNVGRTSMIVWYPDDSTETFLFSVIEDLSVLRHALRDIHPAIKIELSPGGSALVLRGKVPTIKYRIAAEAASRNYLDAGKGMINQTSSVLMQDSVQVNAQRDIRVAQQNDTIGSSAAIINLIQVEELPISIEEKIKNAIDSLGGKEVTISRVIHGDLENNNRDTLLLNGSVKNQIALVRILNITSRLFLNSDSALDPAESVKAIADESGSLISQRGTSSFDNLISSIGGGSAGSSMGNDIRANIGRAKLLSVANGRILSMIEVRDLPQVRISVQMYEVSRSRLKNWRPDMTMVSSDYQAESFSANGNGLVVQPDPTSRIGANGTQIENALQVLGGALVNNFQIGGGGVAFDLLFSMLENEGISRTLSRPTLTVLAGEAAVFQVGGEVPVPRAFAPTGISDGDTVGPNASGVFSGTEFKAFGVQLMVRAMVGENDRITLDIKPTVSTPDTTLTQLIAGSTGGSLNTTAFNTRSLETTTRLRDGQPLIVGGLVSRDISNNQSYTPGLTSIPLIGQFTNSYGKGDNDRELIIIVTPTIVREPTDNVSLWNFPANDELLNRVKAE